MIMLSLVVEIQKLKATEAEFVAGAQLT